MQKFYPLLLMLIFYFSCKDDEADLSGEKEVRIEDFLKGFRGLRFPVNIADTALKTFGDSTIISQTVFRQFIADSALQHFTAGSSNTTIHPAGMLHKKERDFLLATFINGQQTGMGVFVLDGKHKFLASLPLLTSSEKNGYKHSVTITDEPTFIFKKEKINNNISMYSRNGFAYDASSNSFAKVLNDSNEDTLKNKEIINPIDTFPSTNKLSGDYVKDKKNFVAVRDGKNASTYSFFIHFEKEAGKCTGELKGTMSLTDEKNAVFTESGDPCVINFKFATNSITIKEEDNCGNHRGITCPFNFTFKKKKQETRN